MRKVVLIAIVLTVARPAWADDADGYRAMAGTGLAMTIGGGISVLTGLVFAVRTIDDGFSCWFCTPQQQAQARADEASDGRIAKWTLIGGLGSLAVGIPLLCVGVHQLHKNGDQLWSAWVAPTNGGAMAGITLRTF